MVQAIVGLWRKVGSRRRSRSTRSPSTMSCGRPDTLAPAAFFYNWATRSAILPPRPGLRCSGRAPQVWDGEDLIGMIGPLWGERTRRSASRGGRHGPLHRRERAGHSACCSMSSRSWRAPGVW